jgi:hypothetical protein
MPDWFDPRKPAASGAGRSDIVSARVLTSPPAGVFARFFGKIE